MLNHHWTIIQKLVISGAMKLIKATSFNLNQALLAAAQKGLTQACRLLIAQGANRNTLNDEEYTPLLLAAAKDHADTVRALIEAGAYVNATDEEEESALHKAARHNHTATMRVLLEHHALISPEDDLLITPLHLAVENNHLEAVQLLIENGVLDALPTFDSRSHPLLYAAEQGNSDIILTLIHGGASARIFNDMLETPLHWAACGGMLNSIRLLLAYGADLNALDNDYNTPLHSAAKHGRNSVIKELVQRGLNVNAIDRKGNTALHMAANFGHTTCVQTLLGLGANLNVTNLMGETPLVLSVDFRGFHTTLALLESGADETITPANGNTYLHLAVTQRNTKLILALIQPCKPMVTPTSKNLTNLIEMRKSNLATQSMIRATVKKQDIKVAINRTNADGQTPLHIAANFHPNLIVPLLEAGGDFNKQDNRLQTPIMIARNARNKLMYEQFAVYFKGKMNKAKDKIVLDAFKQLSTNQKNALIQAKKQKLLMIDPAFWDLKAKVTHLFHSKFKKEIAAMGDTLIDHIESLSTQTVCAKAIQTWCQQQRTAKLEKASLATSPNTLCFAPWPSKPTPIVVEKMDSEQSAEAFVQAVLR